MVEGAGPDCKVKEGVPKEEAEDIKKQLEESLHKWSDGRDDVNELLPAEVREHLRVQLHVAAPPDVEILRVLKLSLTKVNKEDSSKLQTLSANFKAKFNDDVKHTRTWGGGIMGLKTQAKLEKRRKALEEELAKKLKNQY